MLFAQCMPVRHHLTHGNTETVNSNDTHLCLVVTLMLADLLVMNTF